MNDEDEDYVSFPYFISLVEAGTRIGYRWKDPVPNEESSVSQLKMGIFETRTLSKIPILVYSRGDRMSACQPCVIVS